MENPTNGKPIPDIILDKIEVKDGGYSLTGFAFEIRLSQNIERKFDFDIQPDLLDSEN